MVNVSGSTSVNTGLAPARAMAEMLATAVCEGTATAEPRPMSSPRSSSSMESVPLATPMQCFTPTDFANSCSNWSTSFPRM